MLTKWLNKILQSSADEIDSTLCVTLSTCTIIRAIDKELSLSANYPKGHGELFLEWMQENSSGALLFHSTVGEQSLLPSNWKKDIKEGAYRMDVYIEVTDELDDENDDEDWVGESEIDSAYDPDGDTS